MNPQTNSKRPMKNKGLTLKDQNWINSKCRSIAKLERHGVREVPKTRGLHVGLYAFRQFHKAGLPQDAIHPGLNHQLLTHERA